MIMELPFLVTALERTGSRAGSSSSPTSWIRTGFPNWIAFSICRIQSPIFKSKTLIPDSFSRFRIHLFAWPWGSIMSGQRRLLDIMMALSVESESRGSPAMFQSRICTAFPRTFSSDTVAEPGMPLPLTSWIAWAMYESRYSEENTPRYATNEDEIRTSPVTLTNSSPRSFTFSVHRVRSPPSPEMSFPARISFFSHMSTWFASETLLSLASLKLASSCAILSSTALRRSCFTLRSAIMTERSSSAFFSISRFGSTTLATRSYTSIARTHLQRPVAALDCFSMTAGMNSGFATYVLIWTMTAGGMFSLS
mmetsp:Transcript_41524/g.94563  ORF Transcript_41524/g.94563 Transcript_41524/m.94563 type:complete len:309 (-) Transcript_41524:1212-2138(-)